MEIDAPTPAYVKIEKEGEIKDIKEYNIKSEEKEFKIQIGIIENISKIIFKIDEEGETFKNYYFKSYFSLDELKNINKSFRIFDSINEAFEEIKEIFKNKKVFIKMESDEIELHLNITNFSSSKFEDITINIKREYFKKEKMNELLFKEINQIKKTIEKDKIKINLLEEKLSEEKEKNLNLTKNVNNLINEKNEMKKMIDELIEWKNQFTQDQTKIESKIISSGDEKKLILDRLRLSILYRNKIPTFNLIYRATRDGDDPLEYCKRCDGKKNALFVINTKKGCKFGGYTEVITNFSKGKDVIDPFSFVFSLNKFKIYENLQKEKNAVDHCKGWGPIFRGDTFAVWKYNFLSYDKHTVGTKLESHFGVMDNDYEINNGEKYFSISELEVFQIDY